MSGKIALGGYHDLLTASLAPHHDGPDRACIDQFAESGGDDTRSKQEPDDRACELAGEDRQRRGRLFTMNLVRAELAQSALGFA